MVFTRLHAAANINIFVIRMRRLLESHSFIIEAKRLNLFKTETCFAEMTFFVLYLCFYILQSFAHTDKHCYHQGNYFFRLAETS